MQRYQLARYHVTDASDFYENNDRWEVAKDPETTGKLQPPYRLSVRTPSGSDEPVFSLTSVYARTAATTWRPSCRSMPTPPTRTTARCGC